MMTAHRIVPTALGQVLAGDHAQPRRDDLKDNGHQTGQGNDPQQTVLELCPASQVRAPVSGVHVADADENRRPDKRPPLLPEASLMVRHFHSAMHPLQRRVGRMPGNSRATSRSCVGVGRPILVILFRHQVEM